VSASSCEEDGERPSADSARVANSVAASVETAERRLAELAAEMGRLIETSPAHERESLRDYALSLVRDDTRGAESAAADAWDATDSEGERAPATRSSSAASLVGYGVLLVPVGFLLAIVFPFGLFLALGGVFMVVLGVVTGLLGRFVPKRTGARDS